MASSSSSSPSKIPLVSIPLGVFKPERPTERTTERKKEDSSGTRKTKSSAKAASERTAERFFDGLAEFLSSADSEAYDYPPATPVRLCFGARPVYESKKKASPDDEPKAAAKPAAVLTKLYKKGRYEGIETETCYKLRVLAAGYRKDELKISVENDQLLRISPNKPSEPESEEEEWIDPLELSKLDVDVPADACIDKLSTKFHDGLLLITVPKKPKKVVEFSIKEE